MAKSRIDVMYECIKSNRIKESKAYDVAVRVSVALKDNGYKIVRMSAEEKKKRATQFPNI